MEGKCVFRLWSRQEAEFVTYEIGIHDPEWEFVGSCLIRAMKSIDARRAAEKEERDRKQYERLREKYETR